MTRVLLESGARVAQSTTLGVQLLHMAAQEGQVGVARLLLQHGAPAGATDRAGWSAFHYAANHRWATWVGDVSGQLEVLELLAAAGADVNASDSEGYTCAHSAAQSGKTEILRLLKRLGASPDAKTARGVMPVHVAAEGGRADGCGRTRAMVAGRPRRGGLSRAPAHPPRRVPRPRRRGGGAAATRRGGSAGETEEARRRGWRPGRSRDDDQTSGSPRGRKQRKARHHAAAPRRAQRVRRRRRGVARRRRGPAQARLARLDPARVAAGVRRSQGRSVSPATPVNAMRDEDRAREYAAMDAVLRRAEMGVPLVWSRAAHGFYPREFKRRARDLVLAAGVPMGRADVPTLAADTVVDACVEGRGARGVAGGDRAQPLGRRGAREVHRGGAVGGVVPPRHPRWRRRTSCTPPFGRRGSIRPEVGRDPRVVRRRRRGVGRR